MSIIGDTLRAALDAFSESFADELQEWLVQNSREFSDMHSELLTLQHTNDELNLLCQKKTDELNRLGCEYDELRNDAINTASGNRSLAHENENLKHDLAVVKEERDRLRIERESNKQAIDAMKAMCTSLIKERDSLREVRDSFKHAANNLFVLLGGQ